MPTEEHFSQFYIVLAKEMKLQSWQPHQDELYVFRRLLFFQVLKEAFLCIYSQVDSRKMTGSEGE